VSAPAPIETIVAKTIAQPARSRVVSRCRGGECCEGVAKRITMEHSPSFTKDAKAYGHCVSQRGFV
jgi:hypothetical protein